MLLGWFLDVLRTMVIYQIHSQSFENCYISKAVVGYFRGLQLDIIENHWLSVSISLLHIFSIYDVIATKYPKSSTLYDCHHLLSNYFQAILFRQGKYCKGNTVRDPPKLPLNSSCSSIWTADSADEGIRIFPHLIIYIS
jgi:hypothetical protein